MDSIDFSLAFRTIDDNTFNKIIIKNNYNVHLYC